MACDNIIIISYVKQLIRSIYQIYVFTLFNNYLKLQKVIYNVTKFSLIRIGNF